jgi:hypothetical protein
MSRSQGFKQKVPPRDGERKAFRPPRPLLQS